jgi:hypothetical protein
MLRLASPRWGSGQPCQLIDDRWTERNCKTGGYAMRRFGALRAIKLPCRFSNFPSSLSEMSCSSTSCLCQQQAAPDTTMTFEGSFGRRKRRRVGSTKKPAFNLDARGGVCFFADPSHLRPSKHLLRDDPLNNSSFKAMLMPM